MKIVKKFLKVLLFFLLIPVVYFLASFILSSITVNRNMDTHEHSRVIYLNTNGVHLDIVFPVASVDPVVLKGMQYSSSVKFLSFGWGDENFYLNTQTWGELTFANAFKAMFWKSSTLMHVTRYKGKQADWIEVRVTETELRKLNAYLLGAFEQDETGAKILLEGQGYTTTDDFYKAIGSYSCFKTCNTWVNTGFKESGLKACFWTPFDFGLMGKYE